MELRDLLSTKTTLPASHMLPQRIICLQTSGSLRHKPQSHETRSDSDQHLNQHFTLLPSGRGYRTLKWRIASAGVLSLLPKQSRTKCPTGAFVSCMNVYLKILCIVYICMLLCCTGCENRSPSGTIKISVFECQEVGCGSGG